MTGFRSRPSVVVLTAARSPRRSEDVVVATPHCSIGCSSAVIQLALYCIGQDRNCIEQDERH